MKTQLFLAAAALAFTAAPASAQTTATTGSDRIGQILGQIFGFGNNADASLDGQWTAGRTPLANQRAQFDARIDADVRSGALSLTSAARLKADYAELVALEARYGYDGRFTAAERADLSARYDGLTQTLTAGGYADPAVPARAEVSEGRAAFDARVNAAVTARRLTRAAGTRLKADYYAAVQVEAGYLRDGVLTEAERDDLDNRLDALDLRVGDVAWTAATLTPRARLDAIARAVPTSGLTVAGRTQLLIEHGDLLRLEAAYARLTPTAEERAYLERRLAELEVRARVQR